MANWKKVIVSGSAAELSSLSLDTALTVANGGTGTSTLTDGGVLLGSGAGAVTALGQATNGQLVIGSTGGDPVLSTLTQGTGVTITNTAGGIEIAAAGSGGTVTSVSASGNVNGITLTSDLNSTSPELTLGGTLGSIANSQLTNSTVSYGGVSLALGGIDTTPAFDLTDATSLPLGTGTTGTLATTRGGTNITTYTTGDILYSSAANTLAKLAIGTSGQILAVSSGGIVEWINNDEGDITSVASTTNGGLTVTNGIGPDVTLTLNLNDLSAASVDVSADSIAIIDANDSNGSRKESIADLATAMAGSGLSATSGVLSTTLNPTITASIYTGITGDVSITAGGVSSVNSVQANSVALGTDTTGNYVATLGTGTGVTIGSNTGEGSSPTITVDYGNSANTAAQGNTGVTFLGTANEVDVTTTFTTVGGGGTVTYGLPNDVTIANDLTVLGDLEVSGTASFKHSENLDIADKFITLSSGSTTPTDGGIIVAQAASGGTQVGEGYGFDASAKRWGVTSSLDNDSGAIVPLDYMVTAKATNTSGVAPSSAPIFGGSSTGYGNIHVDTSTEEIYIYS